LFFCCLQAPVAVLLGHQVTLTYVYALLRDFF
jgi:hypothetical protein